jgi:hypothetical protein
LRGGGVVDEFGDAAGADRVSDCVMGAAAGGVVITRAGCMFDDRPGDVAGAGCPTGAVAFAIPMNVAGDSMAHSLGQKR